MKRLLFIDPASISSGFAFFEDGKLTKHGTIAVPGAWPIFERLKAMARCYRDCFSEWTIDEVHIEQLVRTTHIFTHWSVGVIGTALANVAEAVDADVPIRAWQSATGWIKRKGKLTLEATSPLRRFKTQSEDELAAVGMGLYWINKSKATERNRQ